MEDKKLIENIQLIINSALKPLQNEIEKVQLKTRQVTSNVEIHTNKMGNAFKKVAQVVRSSLGIGNILAFGKSCLALASNLSEAENTSNSWANQIALLSSKFQSFKATIGQGLINVFTPVIQVINAVLDQMLILANYLKSFTGAFDNVIDTTTVNKAVSNVLSILEPLKSLNFEPLIGSFCGVVDAARPLGEKVFSGLEWVYYNVLVPLAAWTIEDVLPAFLDVLAGRFDTVNSILTVLQPLWQWVWDSFLQPIASWTGGVIVDALNGLADALKGVSDWIDNNQELVRGMTITVAGFMAAWKVVEILSFIQQAGSVIAALGLIKNALIGETLAKIASETETMILTAMYAKDFVVALALGTAELVKQAAQWVINTGLKIADSVATTAMTVATGTWNIVCGIATAVTTAFGVAVAFLTSPIGLVILAIGALIAIGVLLYENWNTVEANAITVWTAIQTIFQDFDNFLLQVFCTDWSNSFGFVGELMNGFFANCSNIWDSLQMVFGGIIDFVAGVFTGDWARAWQGVQDIFGGIFNGLSDLLKAPLNAVIGLINGAIDGINCISVDIPSWVPDWAGGGSHLGFSIDKISYLAKGGIVSGATPAIIGEDGAEAIIPLERNTGWIDKLAYTITNKIGVSQSGGNATSLTLPIYIGGKQVTNVIIDDINNITKSSGTCPIYI